MAINNARGSAMLEAVPVILLLVSFAVGICLAAYLFFARSWIQYQSEQALYCASVRRSSPACAHDLQQQLDGFLPWGESHAQILGSAGEWTVEVLWKYRGFSINVLKRLSPKQILAVKDLRW